MQEIFNPYELNGNVSGIQDQMIGIQDGGSSSQLMGGANTAVQPLASDQLFTVNQPVAKKEPVAQNTVQKEKSSIDLSRELATIQAMKQDGSGGLGKTIGGVIGTGAGAYFGGTPQAAAAGGAIGEGIGSIVDYMIDGDAKEKAEQIRIDALRKEKANMVKKNQSDAWLDGLAEAQNQSIMNFNTKANKYTVAKQMQGQLMQKLIDDLAKQSSRKKMSNQSFLEGRRI